MAKGIRGNVNSSKRKKLKATRKRMRAGHRAEQREKQAAIAAYDNVKARYDAALAQ